MASSSLTAFPMDGQYLSLFTVELRGETSFPTKFVHDIDDKTKTKLLSPPLGPKDPQDGEALLCRLQELCPDIARDFTVKKNALDKFKLRLWLKGDSVPMSSITSYVALSYRWKYDPVPDTEGVRRYPLEENMFKAIIAQLGDSEGLWFDTCCIRQDDDDERPVSISIMDIVYQCARAVVVALWDVELDHPAAELLRSYAPEFDEACVQDVQDSMKGCGFGPYMEENPPFHFIANPALKDVYEKILSSEYFQRAFCGQEFRVARRLIFLIPCRSSDGSVTREFVRFGSEFLSRIMDFHPFAYKFFNIGTEFRAITTTIQTVLTRKAFRNLAENKRRDNPNMDLKAILAPAAYSLTQKDNFVQSVSDIFSMHAGGNPRIEDVELRKCDANKDKLIVTLNSMEHPLTFVGSPASVRGLSANNCVEKMTMVALASEDAWALCTRGDHLDLGQSRLSWIQQPTNHSGFLLQGSNFQMQPDPDMKIGRSTPDGLDFLQLRLDRLAEIPRPDSSCYEKARAFHARCSANDISCPTLGKYLERSDPFYTILMELIDHILAQFFDCGPVWMARSSSHQKLSLPSQIPEADAISLWSRDEDFTRSDPAAAATDAAAAATAEKVLSYVELIIVTMQPHLGQDKIECFRWLPRCFEVGGQRGLVMAPTTSKVHGGGSPLSLAVPTAVNTVDCEHLPRCWIVEPLPSSCATTISDDDSNNNSTITISQEVSLVEKSLIFAPPELAVAMSKSSTTAEVCRVFGPLR